MSIDEKREQIWQSLNDYEYRHKFIEEEINVGIAFQIRSLRNRQNLTQTGLANLVSTKQSWVSSLENPNYGNYSLTILRRLAKAFDVGLLVRFVPFGKLVDLAANLTLSDIAPPNFSEEQEYDRFIGSILASVEDRKTGETIDANNPDFEDFHKPNPLSTPSTVDNMVGAGVC